MPELHRTLHQGRRLILRHRRWLAALAAAGCILTLVNVLAPPPPATIQIVVAAHDLHAGQKLAAADLDVARVPTSNVVPGAARSVAGLTGKRLSAPMRRGEPITDTRIYASPLISRFGDGSNATPVRLPDADIVSLLRAGDRVDLYAATGDVGVPADRVVSDATVVVVPDLDDRSRQGAVVVLALTDDETARLAQASATTQLVVSVRASASSLDSVS